jgi:hypothetical protein
MRSDGQTAFRRVPSRVSTVPTRRQSRGLVGGRGVNDRHGVEAEFLRDPGQQDVPRGEMALHVRHFVQGGAGVMECCLRALVRCGGPHVQADDTRDTVKITYCE